MPSNTGHLLRSLSSSVDDYFHGALVYMVEHNGEGALGFVINRPFPRPLNELVEFAHLPSFPLYEGGPVDEEHLYFLHRCPNKIEDGTKIANGIYYGGNFKQVVNGIERKMITPGEIRIFVGYCGWHTGDLEKELGQGDWQLQEGIPFL